MSDAVDLARLREELEALTRECERNSVMGSAASKVGALLAALPIIEQARKSPK